MIAAIVVASLAADRPPRSSILARPRTLAEVEEAQVQLVTVRRPEGVTVARGSAFFVDPYGRLCSPARTCWTTCRRTRRPRLRLRDGRERRFTVVTVDRETDLAVLLSDPPAHLPGPGRGHHSRASDRPCFSEGSRRVRWTSTARSALRRPGRSCRASAAGRRECAGRWGAGAGSSRSRSIPSRTRGRAEGRCSRKERSKRSASCAPTWRARPAASGGTPRKGYSAAVPLLYVKPLLEPKD